MGWRTDFKKVLQAELKKIDRIGSVDRNWKQEPDEYPALTICFATEKPERTMGSSVGPVELHFEIIGRVNDIDDPDERLEGLLDDVYERLEAVTGYDLTIGEPVFHERVEWAGKGFTVPGFVGPLEKDFSSM